MYYCGSLEVSDHEFKMRPVRIISLKKINVCRVQKPSNLPPASVHLESPGSLKTKPSETEYTLSPTYLP